MLIYAIFGVLIAASMAVAWWLSWRREKHVLASWQAAGGSGEAPRSQHPRIDVSSCIGCAACLTACPEGDVLGLIGGKAAIVHASKCIGHGVCAEACPVGAIEIVMAHPSIHADLPRLSEQHESSVPGLYIIGELSGLALIKNAIRQGSECIDTIAARIAGQSAQPGLYDVCIVGAGPAGLSATLRAKEQGLRSVTLEQESVGGTVAKYPRQKLVLTSPVDLPLYGRFGKREIRKEQLVEFWQQLIARTGVSIQERERVVDIAREAANRFRITTARGSYLSRTVVLALGRRGTPRKLEVPGEELPKVMYSLIDAEAYRDARILVVGGGDSAVEAALGLSVQRGNQVTLSYRKAEFQRIKERNRQRLHEQHRKRKLEVMLHSMPRRMHHDHVEIDVAGAQRSLPNDFVFVLIGGEPPTELLHKAGVAIGPVDLTQVACRAAAEEVLLR
jgi:thioredoxin reductase/Pyruvate/2-oxoacid:ferredoxin oxidoreductase delta subunit